MSNFNNIRDAVRAQFAIMTKTGQRIFRADIDRDVIWSTYLENFALEDRQSHNCNLCKSFIRQFGGIVAFSDEGKVSTIWDIKCEDPEYVKSISALRRYVASLPVIAPFYHEARNWGTEKNYDAKRDIWWTHFHVSPPVRFVLHVDQIGPRVNQETSDKDVLLRSLVEIKEDAVDTVLELIAQNSIYRGQEHKATLETFRRTQQDAKRIPAALLSNWAWQAVASVGGPVARIRNTSIGTLLTDLSEGKPLDTAVAAFERMVAPANYKRPTSLVTPAMIEKAQKRITELGYLDSLERRTIHAGELPVDQLLYVYRPVLSAPDVFADMKKQTTINPRSLEKTETIAFEDFVQNVLPHATSLELLLENRHFGNMVTLVGPTKPEAKSMFKWPNAYSWSYSGGVADSIKERVKQAGGRVDAFLCARLSWSNYDDLDLHMHTPDGTIYFGQRTVGRGQLDVDMNAGYGKTRTPVENIFFASRGDLRDGRYAVFVHNYRWREDTASGFTVELEVDGELHTKTVERNGTTDKRHEMFVFHVRRGQIEVENAGVSGYQTQTKWGLASGVFHRVDIVTNSPNHWNKPVGNKHAFFLLEGAKSDEKIRSFYNEFLSPELDAERKVLEILGGKLTVTQQPDELSGLGFSDTVRNDVFVRVHGKFKRTLKVTF